MPKITDRDLDTLYFSMDTLILSVDVLIIFSEDLEINSKYIREKLMEECEIIECQKFFYEEDIFYGFMHVVHNDEDLLEEVLKAKDNSRIVSIFKMQKYE